jgi:hypothetical protein
MAHTFLSTTELADKIGGCRTTVWRVCRDNPGFAIRLGRSYKVPSSHLDRVLRGETPAAIAATVASHAGSPAA